jgi:serine protease Do
VRHAFAAGAILLALAGAARAQTPAPADTSAPLPQEILPIRVGQTRAGLLEPGDHTMGDGTWADVWYLTLTAGQRVTIELRSRDFDAYLQLLDPAGNRLAEDDDSAGRSDARIMYTAREAGRYQIVVNNYDDEPDTGRYTLTVR